MHAQFHDTWYRLKSCMFSAPNEGILIAASCSVMMRRVTIVMDDEATFHHGIRRVVVLPW